MCVCVKSVLKVRASKLLCVVSTMRHLLLKTLALALVARKTECLRGFAASKQPTPATAARSAPGSPLSSLLDDFGASSSDFFVIIMRHGERFQDKTITGLAPDGRNRAEYISRCMSASQPTAALPFGAPTAVVSSAVRSGESTRPRDTMLPLAKALGIELDQSVDKHDYDGFAGLVRRSIQPGGALVAAWQHKDIPHLVEALGVPNADQFSSWPDSCDSITWNEPSYIDPSDSCYDAMWQVRFKKSFFRGWQAGPVISLQEGYGGALNSPCAQDLKPIHISSEDLTAKD